MDDQWIGWVIWVFYVGYIVVLQMVFCIDQSVLIGDFGLCQILYCNVKMGFVYYGEYCVYVFVYVVQQIVGCFVIVYYIS